MITLKQDLCSLSETSHGTASGYGWRTKEGNGDGNITLYETEAGTGYGMGQATTGNIILAVQSTKNGSGWGNAIGHGARDNEKGIAGNG